MIKKVKTQKKEYKVTKFIPIQKKCGVYLLYKNKELIYIGSTSNLDSRLKTHSYEKPFDEAVYIDCENISANKMLSIEKELIQELQPILNNHNYNRLDGAARRENERIEKEKRRLYK